MKMQFASAATAAVGALILGFAAAPANATVYNLDVYEAGFSAPLGTMTVTGQGTTTLNFDVQLDSGAVFQLIPGQVNDVFFFDVTGLSGALSFSAVTATPASTTTYTGVGPGSFGQGFVSNYDYAVQGTDGAAPPGPFADHLAFSVTGGLGSTLDLAARTVTIGGTDFQVFAGADLRQLVGDKTITGPAGFSPCVTDCGGGGGGEGGGVPEPATWAFMILGFGGAGAMLRRRRAAIA